MDQHLSERQQELVAELQRIARKLCLESLSQSQFEQHREIGNISTVCYQFGSWNRAIEAAGLKPHSASGFSRPPQLDDAELLQEIIRLDKKLRKPPSETELTRFGKFSVKPYVSRWGSFTKARERAYEMFGKPEME